MKRATKASGQPQVVSKPPPTPEPYQDHKALQEAFQAALKSMQGLADEYGAEEVPDRLLERARAILKAPTLDDAQRIAKRLWDAMLVHALIGWTGPLTEESVKRRVYKALNLANMLEKKGDLKGAGRNRERAARYQAEWEERREQQRRETQVV